MSWCWVWPVAGFPSRGKWLQFRLRAVHGWAHQLFERESVLNTPLFAGFPGFVSKLWLTKDENEVSRGTY